MNEKARDISDLDHADESGIQSETTIVQFEPIPEVDSHEARIGEPSIKLGSKRLKIYEPGEDWL